MTCIVLLDKIFELLKKFTGEFFLQMLDRLKKNIIFKYFSSVKLAIPLLFILLIASVVGTLIESRYNAQVADIRIYSAKWFIILLFFLWANIFCATVSRIPFKKHHTGFVITHIGLLTLLIGSIMTKLLGIDGSIQIQEKTQSNYVSLPQLAYEIGEVGSSGYSKILFPRQLNALTGKSLNFLNSSQHPLFVTAYEPFVKDLSTQSSAISGENALNFKLKSKFFNVNQTLHLSERPEIKMGPALLRYVKVKSKIEAPTKKQKSKEKHLLKIISNQSNQLLKIINLEQTKNTTFEIDDISINITQKFEQALVVSNRIEEGGQRGGNPALELEITTTDKKFRDVIYAKFPSFSMLAKENLPFRVEYIYPNIDVSDNLSLKTIPMGNVIEFVQLADNQHEIEIVLLKNKKEVLNQKVKLGETVVTPWMGMEITILSIGNSKQPNDSDEIDVIKLPKKSPLPPSAIKISNMDGDSTWIVENSSKSLNINGAEISLYFGQNSLLLPFSIYLEKFYKIDYPGSTRPMSYESDIKLNAQGAIIKIAMNEPYKYGGYTFYQSSYILRPGRPPITVLSVNKDPGRWVKYIGSLILCLGIMIFTLMRSRVYTKTG